MNTKIRKIGNSAGLTLSKEILSLAGFQEGQEVHVAAGPGAISITAEQNVRVVFTLNEAKALASGDLESPAGITAQSKIRLTIQNSHE